MSHVSENCQVNYALWREFGNALLGFAEHLTNLLLLWQNWYSFISIDHHDLWTERLPFSSVQVLGLQSFQAETVKRLLGVNARKAI